MRFMGSKEILCVCLWDDEPSCSMHTTGSFNNDYEVVGHFPAYCLVYKRGQMKHRVSLKGLLKVGIFVKQKLNVCSKTVASVLREERT